MTKSELQNYCHGWSMVNKYEIKELRSTSMAKKVRQFLTIAASMNLFGYYSKKMAELKDVQKRWQILRKKLCHAR